MAIFHSHIQIITRGKGKSAVAAAAYRAGAAITNEYDGVTHDYLHKAGVVHTEILLPPQAPAEYKKRAVLWNAVEKVEKAKNSQLARELDIAIPAELTKEQGIALAREYVQTAFVSAGMCADLCVHDTGKGNPHFHVMLTLRPINDDGSWGDKNKKEYILDCEGNKIYNPKTRQYKCRSVPTTDWNNRDNADKWRKIWEDMANAALEKYGHGSRIDRRSYAEQGVELVPGVHLGAAVIQIEKKGMRTERGDMNRKIAGINAEIRQVNARLSKLEKWLVEEKAKPEMPTLFDVIDELSRRQGVSGYTQLHNMADVMNFLIRNRINDYAGLENKVADMKENLGAVRSELKKVDRRIETLKKHISQSVNYRQYRKFRKHYDKLRAKYEETQKATGLTAGFKVKKALDAANNYRNAHRKEIECFNEADKYLRDVLQAHFDPNRLPTMKWERELAEKLERRDMLAGNFKSLKDETRNVEQIKRSVERMLSGDASASADGGKDKFQSAVTQKPKPGILGMLNKYLQMQISEHQQPSGQTQRKSYNAEM